MGHTPLPWVVNRGEYAHITNPLYKGIVAVIEHSPDAFLFVCNPNDHPVTEAEYLANAEFIVRAVNSHDELLACVQAGARYSDALAGIQRKSVESCGSMVEGYADLDRLFEDWHDKAHAVLAKLEPVPPRVER